MSVDALDLSDASPGTSVLCLAERDKPVFSRHLSDTTLGKLQKMLANAANLLWVTANRLLENPYSNMMIGIGRSLALELPHVKMQFLDFDQQSSWDMEMAVQYLLRMVALSSSQYKNHGMMWIQEPEIIVKRNTTLIPRLVPDRTLNESLNANRRRVTKSVNPSDSIQISYASSPPSLIKSNLCAVPEGAVEIDIELFVPLALDHERALFLYFGHVRGSSKPAFALSETDSSVAIVSSDNVLELSSPLQCNAKLLVAVGASLVASYLLFNSLMTGTILVYALTSSITDAIARKAKSMRRNVLFITAMEETNSSNWTVVNPLAHPSTIRLLLPEDAAIMWRLCDLDVDNILLNLPRACLVQNFDARCLHLSDQLITIDNDMNILAQRDLRPSIIKINDSDAILHSFNMARLSTV